MAKKFDRIKEMIEVITPQKVKNIEILDQNMRDDSKVQMLYDAIITKEIDSEEDAVLLLYGDVDSKDAYYKVQQRLYDRLLNSFYFIDHKKAGFNDRQLAYYEAYRLWALARIVRERGAHNTALELFEKSLKYSLEYDFNELVTVICLELFDLYSIRFADKTKFNYVRQLYNERYPEFQADCRAQELFYYLVAAKINTKSDITLAEEWKFAESYVREIINYKKEVSSTRFLYYGYMTLIEYYKGAQRYDRVIELGKEAIKKYEEFDYNISFMIAIYAYEIIYACIQIGDYNQGENFFIDNINKVKKYFYNWYLTYYLYLVLNMHKQEYDVVVQILEEIMGTKQFHDLPEHLKENYEIIRGYTILFKRVYNLDLAIDDTKFRLYSFLNNIPLYSKDKRGINVALLIFQFLYMLHDKKYNQVIDRVDALNQYAYKYLRVDTNFRSNCFIKMLTKIPKADFHPVRVEAHTKSLHKKLIDTPRIISSQALTVEVIPYENLWEIVMDILYKNLKEERGIDLRPERSK